MSRVLNFLNKFQLTSLLLFQMQVVLLSIAIGGDWEDSIKFLSLLSIQISAGAIIWIYVLKRFTSRSSLTVFEMLSTGAVISYSVVGICQLIDSQIALSSSWFIVLSPLIVALPLLKSVLKIPGSLKVERVESGSTLVLLFWAPLGISFSVVEVLPLYVIPLALFAIYKFLKSRNGSEAAQISYSARQLFVGLGVLSAILWVTVNHLRLISPAVAILGDDELYDLAHAKGYATWGINENINFVGQYFRLYKFSQLWLGSILETFHFSPTVASSILPLVFFGLIGSALWTLALQITKSVFIANTTSILIFVQSSLPEPYMIERRPLYLWSTLIILVFVSIYITVYRSRVLLPLFVGFSTFVFFSTRVQHAFVFLLSAVLMIVIGVRRREIGINAVILSLVFALVGLGLSYLIFFDSGIANSSAVVVRSITVSLSIGAGAFGFRVFLPLILVHYLKFKYTNFYILHVLLFSALVTHLFVPGFQNWRYPIEIILLFGSVFTAILFEKFRKNLESFFSAAFLFTVVLIGLFNRFVYDIVKWIPKERENWLLKSLSWITQEGLQQTLFTSIQLALILIVVRISTPRFAKLALLKLGISSALLFFGAWIGTELRGISVAAATNQAFFESQINDSKRWLLVNEYSEAIDFFINGSKVDDIFATNVHKYDENFVDNGSSLIITSLTGRRSFVEAPNFDRSINENTPPEFFRRMEVSLQFPIDPKFENISDLAESNVDWFIVDLERTPLRSWEPWATTEFINDKVAVLRLAKSPTS